MKKLMGLIMIIVILTACSENKEFAKENESKLELEKDNYVFTESLEIDIEDNLSVFVDPRIEATNLVMEMIKDETGYSMYRDSNYMNAQVEHFSKYKDHRVFDMARQMYKNGFSFDAISGNLHSVNGKGDIIKSLIVDEARLERAGGAQQIKDFIDALYKFKAKSP